MKQRCEGITIKGARCKRKAWDGEKFCGTHMPEELEVLAPAPATRGAEDDFSAGFQEVIDLCWREIANPSDGTNHLQQWARLLLDATRHAKEELRELESVGAGVQYICITTPPTDKPKPPPDSKSVEMDENFN